MPTAKGKGGAAAPRYRPASECDDAVLAQKREYWRNKKREQRARLTEHRGKPAQAHQGARLPPLNAPAGATSCLPDTISVSSSPLRGRDSFNRAPQSRNTKAESLLEATKGQKVKWLQTTKLNKVLPPLPACRPVSAKPAGGNRSALKHPAASGALCGAVTSADSGSSVPPATETPTVNGRSATTTPQPFVSMQGTLVPKPQDEAQSTPPTTGVVLLSAPCGPLPVQSVCPTPRDGANSALLAAQRAKGSAQPSSESEEEKAAKRREQWRIKKREQRAKLAKTRQKKQGAEAAPGGAAAGRMLALPPRPLLRAPAQKQCAGRAASQHAVAARTLQTDPFQSPCGDQVMQSVTVDGSLARRPLESLRKLPNQVYVHSVTRGVGWCRTPRQRFIEAQKTFMNFRNLRYKSPFVSSVFGPKRMPRIDPNDTPEQIIAKRREYWRIKKREQRAKLSVEVKARLKDKDSLMRRVKRYQNILEEMRKARAQTRSVGGSLGHASETIGGFIKEDGTVTVNIPKSPTPLGTTAASTGPDDFPVLHKNRPDRRHRGVAPVQVKAPPPPQVKVSFPLANKPLPSNKQRTRPENSAVPGSRPLAAQAAGQLTLSHPDSPRSRGPAAGCVMKMAVSCSSLSLSLDPGLSEEEKMAKKREYWRVKKREQRAARAFRLNQGVFQARTLAALQRRKVQKQASKSLTGCTGTPGPRPASRVALMPHGGEIKEESQFPPVAEQTSQPENSPCPDIKPPLSPPPQPELDPALSADSQATLLAVASMKKLLEESLSTVAESQTDPADVKVESTEDSSEEDVKPDLPQLFFESSALPPPAAADLALQVKSSQPEDEDAALQADPTGLTRDSLPPLPPTCEHSSQTPSSFILAPTAPDGPSLLHRCTQNSPESQAEQWQHPPDGQPAATQNSLQRKREYWKLMKRQQRARLKERTTEPSPRSSHRNVQPPGLVMILPKQPAAPPPAPEAPPSPDSLLTSTPSPPGALQLSEWMCDSTDSTPSLPTLRPPDNPLASIDLQPIEPLGHSPDPLLGPLSAPGPPIQSPSPVGILAPPKRVPGESEEDFLRRKREYWRLKKKEQRARKAIREKGGLSPGAPNSSRALHTQDGDQWLDCDASPQLSDSGTFPCLDPVAPGQDEVELLFSELDSPGGGEAPVSDGVWRSRYLMDYEPLNQLLVCMVCGELQYCHSLEAVGAHIDEAHPHTLGLDPRDKQRILEAWDEQVSRRERFFSSQLQQQTSRGMESQQPD